jgi:hypothetical protein
MYRATRQVVDGISARMTTRQLWIASIATLSFAACAKSDSGQAPMTKLEATKPVEKPVVPAVAPTPTPAPTVAPPAKAATKHETQALALLHEIARKTLTTDRFDPTRAFALVDLSTRPAVQGGGQRRVIKGLCASAEEGLEVLDGLGTKLHADAAQLEDAFAKDAVTCTTKSTDLVSCDVRAYEAGKATLTYLISFAKGRVVPVGYARRETFASRSNDRLAADAKTIDDTFAKYSKKSCL